MSGSDTNAYTYGSDQFQNAGNAYGDMSTLGNVGSIANGAGAQQIAGLNPVDSNQLGGYGGQQIAGTNPITSQAGQSTVANSGNTIDHYGQYMNQYIGDVTDAAMTDMGRANDMLLNQNAANAGFADAFGGSRHGLVDSVTNSDTIRNMGMLSGQLNSQGFNSAMGLAAGHVGQDMARGNALSNLSQQDFGNQMAQGQSLAQLQGQDTANAFQNWGNQFSQGATAAGFEGQDIANQFAQNQQNNQTMLGQGSAQQGLANDAYTQGDKSMAAQAAAGNQAQQASQAFMDAAANIFDGNSPEQVLSQLTSLLSGNPLTAEGTGTSTRTPSGAEKASMVMGGIGDLMGGSKDG